MTNQTLTESEFDLLQEASFGIRGIYLSPISATFGKVAEISIMFSNTPYLSEEKTVSAAESIWQTFVDCILPNRFSNFKLNDYFITADEDFYFVNFQIRVPEWED
jgi:hypothetical protein